MGPGDLSGKPDEILGGNLAMAGIHPKGSSKFNSLLLHATETTIKVWLDGQHGLSVDFTFQLCIWLLSNAMYCR